MVKLKGQSLSKAKDTRINDQAFQKYRLKLKIRLFETIKYNWSEKAVQVFKNTLEDISMLEIITVRYIYGVNISAHLN